jgi:putative IMPACT (imprinted ancient) family translation regulator
MIVKASRFIGEAAPVEMVDKAQAYVESIRKREYNASHHCFAYRLGCDSGDILYSDAGELSGTGRTLIHQHIDSRELTNIAVVTRYHGGPNLGAGGLIRAYSDTSSGALWRMALCDVHYCPCGAGQSCLARQILAARNPTRTRSPITSLIRPPQMRQSQHPA